MNPLSRKDLILHPQRLAILLALSGAPRTTKELASSLGGIPQASLYRHVAALLAAGLIAVTAERQVRGAVERTYALVDGAILTADDLAGATPEDHFRYFGAFLSGLLDEYARYLDRPRIDLEADGVGYRQQVLNLTDGELLELLADIRALLDSAATNTPSTERHPRLFASVTMPYDERRGDQRDHRDP